MDRRAGSAQLPQQRGSAPIDMTRGSQMSHWFLPREADDHAGWSSRPPLLRLREPQRPDTGSPSTWSPQCRPVLNVRLARHGVAGASVCRTGTLKQSADGLTMLVPGDRTGEERSPRVHRPDAVPFARRPTQNASTPSQRRKEGCELHEIPAGAAHKHHAPSPSHRSIDP
jgi:hypothetical protein